MSKIKMNIEGSNIKKNWLSVVSVIKDPLLVITQISIAIIMFFQCCATKEQVNLIKEQVGLIKCQKLRNRYFTIYKYYKEDLEELKPSDYLNLNKDKVKTKLIRIANNTIRHFSFESENPYLVFKALENVLSYKYPENKTDHKNKKDNKNKKNHILANLKTKPQLSEIIEALKEDNEKWPNKKDYDSWNKETECF